MWAQAQQCSANGLVSANDLVKGGPFSCGVSKAQAGLGCASLIALSLCNLALLLLRGPWASAR